MSALCVFCATQVKSSLSDFLFAVKVLLQSINNFMYSYQCRNLVPTRTKITPALSRDIPAGITTEMASLESIKQKDVSKFELRDIIDALTNNIAHLERSQQELINALQVDPADSDFKLAYDENIEVIAKKYKARKELKDYLKDMDIAYYMQYYSEQEPEPNFPTGQETQSGNVGVYL